mmetsp:Transcript_70511/g.228519  ORF Transcript_70511/g.228519 Transcript_70511/m.228519 type:complete len:260 (+) Transcript_70511:196-975(+)
MPCIPRFAEGPLHPTQKSHTTRRGKHPTAYRLCSESAYACQGDRVRSILLPANVAELSQASLKAPTGTSEPSGWRRPSKEPPRKVGTFSAPSSSKTKAFDWLALMMWMRAAVRGSMKGWSKRQSAAKLDGALMMKHFLCRSGCKILATTARRLKTPASRRCRTPTPSKSTTTTPPCTTSDWPLFRRRTLSKNESFIMIPKRCRFSKPTSRSQPRRSVRPTWLYMMGTPKRSDPYSVWGKFFDKKANQSGASLVPARKAS